MKNKSLLYIVIVLSSLTLFSCDKKSDVDLLNQRVDELIDNIERHQLDNIKGYLANDFLTAKNLNKTQFLIFIRHHLRRNKSVSISILNKEILLNESSADVIFKVLLLGSNEWLPERGQIYNVTSRWKKESGSWVVSRLRWEKNTS